MLWTISCKLLKVLIFTMKVQFSSVSQSCLTLCDPMNHSTPGLLVHHQLPEFTQTHIHRVGDAIQPSHPLSSPSPPTFNLSLHQGLLTVSPFFASGGQSIGISALASVLTTNTQDWFPLGWTGWTSLQSKGLSRVFVSKELFQFCSFRASPLVLRWSLLPLVFQWNTWWTRI